MNKSICTLCAVISLLATSPVAAQFGNTNVGKDTLASNTTGNYNTANGYKALADNTTG